MEDQILKNRREFIDRTDKRSIKRQIQNYINNAKEECSKNLESRREKMRQLINEEDNSYFSEYEANVKSAVEENVKKRQEFLLNLKRIKDKEEENFVRNKTLQCFFDHCDGVRTEVVKQNAKTMTMTRLAQIQERKLLQQNEIDEDCFYVQSENLCKQFDDENEHKFACCQKMIACKAGNDHLQAIHRNAELLKKKKEAEALKRKLRLEKERADAVIQRGDEAKRKEELIAKKLFDTKQSKEQRDYLEKSKKEFDEYYQNLILCDIKRDECAIQDQSRCHHISNENFKNYMKTVKNDVKTRNKHTDSLLEAEWNKIICKRAEDRKPKIKFIRDPPPPSGICQKVDICNNYDLLKANRCAELYATSLPMKSPRRRNLQESRKQYKAELDEQIAANMAYKKVEQERFQLEEKVCADDAARCDKILEANIHTRLDNRPVHPNWSYMDCKCGDSMNFVMPNINYTKPKSEVHHSL